MKLKDLLENFRFFANFFWNFINFFLKCNILVKIFYKNVKFVKVFYKQNIESINLLFYCFVSINFLFESINHVIKVWNVWYFMFKLTNYIFKL